jgi:hypothetical protein
MHVSQSRPPAIQIIVDTGATVTVVRDLQRLGATSIVDCSLRLVGIAPTRARRKGVLTADGFSSAPAASPSLPSRSRMFRSTSSRPTRFATRSLRARSPSRTTPS